METIAQKALRLLEPVPADKWLSGEFTNEIDSCCVIGHYQRLTSNNPQDYSEDNCADWGFFREGIEGLRKKSMDFIQLWGDHSFSIVDINNDFAFEDYVFSRKLKLKEKYPQANRKDRVIAFLKDMIAAGY